MGHKKDELYYVSELVEKWLLSNEYKIARSTYVKYERLAKNYVVPFFQSVPYEELNDACLNAFYNEISQKEYAPQRLLSAGNRRIIFMIVNNTLEYAYTLNLLHQKFYIKPRLSKSRKIVRVFSEEDQKKLEAYAIKHQDRYSLAIMIGMFMGLRIGEICALQWKDISFETGALYVNKTVQRLPVDGHTSKTELVVSQPKSASAYRLIPMPEFMIEYLKMFYTKNENAYILTKTGKAPMEPRSLQYRYKKILQELEIPYLNFHCLRHTFATRCVTLGWDMKTLSEILGHFDIKVTMEYYFHSSFEYKKMQMSKICLLSQN